LYSSLTFDTFRLDRRLSQEEADNLKRAVELAKQYAEQSFIERSGVSNQAADRNLDEKVPRWLVFTGPTGCGKTHLAAAIANAHAARNAGVMFVRVSDLLDHLRGAYGPSSEVSHDRRLDEVKDASLLILDDLGGEASTQWANLKLYQLFDYRYVAHLPTVVTSTQKLDTIEASVDSRLTTRLRDKRLCKVFAIRAPAYVNEQQPQRSRR
jgi:DNA replication protein DnaC